MFVTANGVRLAYESFGREDDEVIVLIMGLGTQMLGWRRGFCELLASQGFRVLRFDNRDVGASSRIEARSPNLALSLVKRSLGLPLQASYTMDDMATDVLGLLDGLRIDKAHVVGASMGGLMAQHVALDAPERVRSLGLLMSSTGEWTALPTPRLALLQAIVNTPVRSEKAQIERRLRTLRLVGSPNYLDETELRAHLHEALARAEEKEGYQRQFQALLATPSRRAELTTLPMPTLIVHGEHDRLLHPAHGKAVADAIPNARWMLVEGMGHDLPEALWPRITEALVRNARRRMPKSPFTALRRPTRRATCSLTLHPRARTHSGRILRIVPSESR